MRQGCPFFRCWQCWDVCKVPKDHRNKENFAFRIITQRLKKFSFQVPNRLKPERPRDPSSLRPTCLRSRIQRHMLWERVLPANHQRRYLYAVATFWATHLPCICASRVFTDKRNSQEQVFLGFNPQLYDHPHVHAVLFIAKRALRVNLCWEQAG